MHRAIYLATLLLTATPAAAAPAQATEQVARPDAAALVAEIRRIIAERYVLPERRPALDAVLAEGLTTARYATPDPVQLAERINADLARVGQDKHLGLRFDQSAATPGPRRPGPFDPAAFARQISQMNHGVRELRVLPGNVRVMTYDGFHHTGPESDRAIDAALTFLSGGDAVIIDLRANGGGSVAAVQRLISGFLPPETPLATFHMGGEPVETVNALGAGVVPRITNRPLYVLVSNTSASAAEEFVGHVIGYRLGEVVGETTAGAAFNNEIVRIHGGFVLSVSVGRPVLASTGGDWEATGFTPTRPTTAAAALNVAYSEALTKLSEGAEGRDREQLMRLARDAADQVTN